MSDERNPGADLARLAAGLGAALSRRERSGHRRLPALGEARVALPPAPSPDPGEASPPGGETALPDRGSSPTLESHVSPSPSPPQPDGPEAGAPPRAPASPQHNDPGVLTPQPARPGPARAPRTDARVDALAKALTDAQAAAFRAKVAEVEVAARAARDLDELRAAVAQCQSCKLCKDRTQTVFSDGSPAARVMFVGEAPGADEDRTGVPFVGRAGQLLSDIIAKGMRLERANDVYIANVIKCRPPANRDPSPHEKAICAGWLERQLELVDPRVVLTLGAHASGHLLQSEDSMGRLRGRVHERAGRKIVPTYHPAYALRLQGTELADVKRKIWMDVQLAMAELDSHPMRSEASGYRPLPPG